MRFRALRLLLFTFAPTLACTLTVTTLPAQKLYIAQRGQNGLWQVNADGTRLSNIIPSNASRYFDFYDVDVDHDGGSVYLANGLEGTIVRAGLNGQNPTTIIPETAFRSAIAVDPIHDKLYFSSSSSSTSPYQVQSANLDGSDVRSVLDAYTNDLAVDPEAGYLFTTRLTRAGLDGQNPVIIQPSGANGIAVDTFAQKIYWTDGSLEFPCCGDPNPVRPGHIYRANYDGSNVEILFSNDDLQDLFTSEIAVDPVRGMMYWYNPILNRLQSATTDGVLVSANLLGTQIPLVEGLAIDYIIPEPPTALFALAAASLAGLAARRRRTRLCRRSRLPGA